jgi:hypothetical protein
MKSIFSKVIFFFTAITTICYAKDKPMNIEPATECEKSCSSWSVVEDEAPCNCGYNCPARINPVCGWDFDIYGDFLYWQAREKGLAPYNHTTSVTSNGQTISTERLQNIDFDYHPAFKVGIGAGTERDNWTFNLEYTRFNATNSKKGEISLQDFSVTATSQNNFNNILSLLNSGIFNTFLTFLSTTTGAPSIARSFDAHWKLNFNTIDLVAGRPYFLGTKLTLSPFYGVRGGWIDQHYKLTSLIPLTTATAPKTDYLLNSLVKSDSWLVGPRIGVKSNWLLGAGFRIFGDAGASLIYQNFKVKIKTLMPAQNQLTIQLEDFISQKIKSVNPTFDAALGFGWGSYFNNKRWHFDLTAGYEFQFFYSQNELLEEIRVSKDTSSLILHGLTVAARFDF